MDQKEIEAYNVLQAEWAKSHPAGTRVKILRSAKTHEMGWQNSWENEMDARVGNIYTISSISNAGIWFKEIGYGYPFYILGKATEQVTRITIEELPIEVRKAAYQKYRDILEEKEFDLDVDWTSSNCAVCQHLKKTYNVEKLTDEFCREKCPLVADGWCDCGEADTSRLYYNEDETYWEDYEGTVEEFLDWIKPPSTSLKAGDKVRVLNDNHCIDEKMVGKILEVKDVDPVSKTLHIRFNDWNWYLCFDQVELVKEEPIKVGDYVRIINDKHHTGWTGKYRVKQINAEDWALLEGTPNGDWFKKPGTFEKV
jgi:hypothetical protein